MTRHCLYFLLPVVGAWEAAADRLLRRADLFDGAREAAVVDGPARIGHPTKDPVIHLDRPDAAEHVLRSAGFRVHRVPATYGGESAGFYPLFDAAARYTGPGDVTFYGHGKGVCHPWDSPAHGWADLMHRACLDHWPRVARRLEERPAAGPLKLDDFMRSGRSIYAGAFFWFRNRETFGRADWRDCPPGRWGGVEMWPGHVFEPGEMACVWEPLGPLDDPYAAGWLARARARYDAWAAAGD